MTASHSGVSAERTRTRLTITLLATLLLMLAQFTGLATGPTDASTGGDFGACSGMPWVKFDYQSGQSWTAERSSDLSSDIANPVLGTATFKDGEPNEPISVPWTSSTPVSSSHTKAGNNPPSGNQGGGTSGTVSVDGGPKMPAISFIVFCFDPPTPTVDLSVDKLWFDTDGTTTTAPAGGPFVTVTAGQASTTEDGPALSLPPGTSYTVSEDLPAGWAEIPCKSVELAGVANSGTGTFTLGEQDTVHRVCNQQIPPDGDTITLIKQWFDPSGEPTEVASSLTAQITVSFVDDDLADIVTDVHDTEVVSIPRGSAITVTETGTPAGWSQIDCPADDGANGPAPTRIDQPDTYVFCNQQDPTPPNGGTTPTSRRGEVTVTKTVTGEAEAIPTDATFTFAVACGSLTETITLTDGESDTLRNIPAGRTCTVTETGNAGADATTWRINGELERTGDGTTTDAFTVRSRDRITVTFTNEYAEVLSEIDLVPDISVVKSAIDGVVDGEDGTLVVELLLGRSAPVTYRYVVTNIGEDDLLDLTLLDDKLGDLTEQLIEAVEEVYGDAILPVDGSVTVTAVHEVAIGDADPTTGQLTNVVDVTGTGVDSGTEVTDQDHETVTVTEIGGVIVRPPDDTDDPVIPISKPTTEVLPISQKLPVTGLTTGGLVGLGLLLSMIGAMVLRLGRRREGADGSS